MKRKERMKLTTNEKDFYNACWEEVEKAQDTMRRPKLNESQCGGAKRKKNNYRKVLMIWVSVCCLLFLIIASVNVGFCIVNLEAIVQEQSEYITQLVNENRELSEYITQLENEIKKD